MTMRRALMLLMCLTGPSGQAWAGPDGYDPPNPPPSVIEDTAKADDCTVAYLVMDTAMNDMFAVRMRITPAENDRAAGGVMPCPRDVPPRVATRALDACAARASDPKVCVYADMGRGFATQPNANNTAENTSRCSSDRAVYIGVACWRSGPLDICGVGCGVSPESAIGTAVSRCESRHQQSCGITGSLPVLAPR